MTAGRAAPRGEADRAHDATGRRPRGLGPSRRALLGLLPLLAGAPAQDPAFTDVTGAWGVDFVHVHGGTGERYMVETMGSGLGVADLDVDGRADLVFAQGAATPGSPLAPAPRNRAWRGGPGPGFTPIPDTVGPSSQAWSMGVAIADYDNDGFPDIFVTNFGADQLYRGNGDGTFTEVAAAAGVAGQGWSSSAAWADLEGNGDLDLYVARYVDFDWDHHLFCGDAGRGLRAYCHPDVYDAVADLLYRNEGDGTFVEIGEAAGVADRRDGKGLGVVFGDWDNDGDPDAYVANDSTRNFLYTNVDGSRFVEDGLMAGAGFNADGQPEAGMGTDWGDPDGDGDLDVFVTNLDLETNTFYRNLGDGTFEDATRDVGLADPGLLFVGFGANWLDVDNDGDLDLFVANGHIIDNIAEFRDNIVHAQRNHLYLNDGHGVFAERGSAAGSGLDAVKVSRGSAIGDLDNDGDLDIVVSNNGDRADVLRNDGPTGKWIQLRLVGRTANRTAAGARVVVRDPGAAWRPQLREVTAGSSYASSSTPRVHVGLDGVDSVDVEVRWPGGSTETYSALAAGRRHVIVEGRGVVASAGPE